VRGSPKAGKGSIGNQLGRSSLVLYLAAAQLIVPAVIYLLVRSLDGGTLDFEYLLPNYRYMAAPHLIVCMLLFWPRFRRPALIHVLTLLNVVLASFQVWILLAVPPREGALAWIFYIPVWVLALVACGVAWSLLSRSRTRIRARPSS